MSKAILVMDMPESCRTCYLRVIGSVNFLNFCTGADCRKIDQMKIINENIKPDWCPLRPMPEKKQLSGDVHNVQSMAEEISAASWNACIDEITTNQKIN